MSYNYAPNYMSMIQALQSGGVQGASACVCVTVSGGGHTYDGNPPYGVLC